MSREYHGHMTMPDGSHRLLSADEAEDLWQSVEREKARRAKELPTTLVALDAINTGRERLRELGWREATYCPKDGSAFAVMTFGSTGIFRAFYMGDWPDGSIIADDCCTHPDGSMWKPLDQLDDAERERLGQCDASLAAHMDRMARMAESFDDHGDE